MGDSMSTIINATTTNGVVIQPDNSGSLVLQTNSGTTALTISTAQNATFAGTVTLPTGTIYPIVPSTAVASTSGTSIDFTSIPSWVERITIMFQGVSTNGSSITQIQLGTSGGIVTSSYLGSGFIAADANTPAIVNMSSGFLTSGFGAAGYVRHGSIVISNITGNSWVAHGITGQSDSTRINMCGGSISLSGTLDRVRITTVNGTDTFDAGSINILYE
jgi:hypothetical protein